MEFEIFFGYPEIDKLMSELSAKRKSGKLSKDGIKFHNKLGKAFTLLSQNPKHNSLETHEIKELSKKFGKKVFQSYFENRTPAAARFFWAHGPEKNNITVLAIESHPEDKKRGAYKRINLSNYPSE
ncbi:MAG: hypothetical protein U5K00_21735 [Melioribacteraceae bacterium]|nr:hypothetical protein [Melioribacteraceae bacterium]